MAEDAWILTLNAGSSSLKLGAFDREGAQLAAHQISGVDVMALPEADARASVETLRAAAPRPLAPAPLAVGHRVVHGMERHEPCLLDAAARADAERASTFAPLHNPPALRVADLAAALFPGALPIVCWDTAFHAPNPPLVSTFALPPEIRAEGIRRYGFHGLSYASLVRRFEALAGVPLPRRLLALHLGAGASEAAIVDGVGLASTMGFSPLDGLVMATRPGALDPGVVLHLIRGGRSVEEVERLLNRESGLKGLAGAGDMRTLLSRDDAEARFAVDLYVDRAARQGAGLICVMGGLDGLAFTGGVGEHAAPIREAIVAKLAWAGASPEKTWVIPADEEGEIAVAAARLLAAA
ncbi:MAG: acetate kinase [Pseudomonadota bacterium]